MAMEELKRLMDDETIFYRDIKTQFVDYTTKKVVVISSKEQFLFPLLYDMYSGNVFDKYILIEAVVIVEKGQECCLEVLYCNFFTGGMPKFKDLRITTSMEEMVNADYVIIFPDVDWGDSENKKTRKEVICDQFPLLRNIGRSIEEYCHRKCKILLIGDCLSTFRLILGLYSTSFPHENIHGITRQYERQAAAVIATELKVPMREIFGIGVFGEDIVESTNSTVEFHEELLDDETYEETLMRAKPELYRLIKMNEQGKDDILEKLTGSKNIGIIDVPYIPLYNFNVREPEIVVEEFSEEHEGNPYYMADEAENRQETEMKWEEVLTRLSLLKKTEKKINQEPTGDEMDEEKEVEEEVRWTEEELEAWLNERYPDRTGKYSFDDKIKIPLLGDRLRIIWARSWLSKPVTGCHSIPKEWKSKDCMVRQLHQKPAVRGIKWVVSRLNDEKFHCSTLPEKAKKDQNCYTMARAISDYIIMLQKKSVKKTNALVCSPGIYNVPPGIFFSFPVVFDSNDSYLIIDGYCLSETTYLRIRNQVRVLKREYDFILRLFREFPPIAKKEKSNYQRPKYEESEEMFMEQMESEHLKSE